MIRKWGEQHTAADRRPRDKTEEHSMDVIRLICIICCEKITSGHYFKSKVE